MVMVASHHHHRSHFRQIEKRLIDDLLCLRSRRRGIEDVSRHQDQVDLVGSGDAGNLSEHLTMLIFS
jgi:hypothetical protein